MHSQQATIPQQSALEEVQLVFMIFRKQPFYSSTHYSWPSRDCVLLQKSNSFNRFSKILQQNDLEKATKSPMNTITRLSADILIWLSAERYFNKQACTGCVSQYYLRRVALYLNIIMLSVSTRLYLWRNNTAVWSQVRDDQRGWSF